MINKIVIVLFILSLLVVVICVYKKSEKNNISQTEIQPNIEQNESDYDLKHFYRYMYTNNITDSMTDEKQRIQIYNKYLKEYPNNNYIILRRAHTYHILGKNKEAINDYKLLLSNEQKNTEYIQDFAQFYIDIDDLKSAQNTLEKYYQNIQKDSGYYYINGQILAGYKKYDLALQSYNKAIELDNNNYLYYLSRSIIYNYLGMFKESQKDMKMSQDIKNSEKSPQEKLFRNNK